MPGDLQKPSWDRLYATAAAQAGFFTTRQAADAGYSSPLLFKHVGAGRVARERRGVYRLVHFPAVEHAELVVPWLWSEQVGIVSHQSALALHELSDVLPAKTHLTLPRAWRSRRFRVPPGVVLHHKDVRACDRAWFGAVPATAPTHTLNDCARSGISPELLGAATTQALRRGLVVKADLCDVAKALKPFGGIVE